MTTDQRSRNRDSDTAFIIMIVFALVLGGALPAVVMGLLTAQWLRHATPGDRERQIVVVFFALVGLGIIYLFREIYPLILPELRAAVRSKRWEEVWSIVKVSWVVTLPAAPWIALAWNTFRPKTMEEQVQARDAQAAAKEQRQRTKAQRNAANAPATVGSSMVLGSIIAGDLHQWQRQQWLVYPERELSQHAVAIGASGSGKTETLLRIASLAAQVYGWQVIYLDAKGEEKTAARFLAAMQAAKLQTVPYFPGRAYHGWRGDARAIANRLHALQTFSEPYYADVAMQVLSLAVNAPAGVPRNSAELVRRLGIDVLRELYQGHADAFKVERLRADDVRGVYQRYAGFFDAVGGTLDGRWSLEQVDAAYFLIQGTAFKREAASLGRFLMEDIAHYVTERKRRDRPVLIIIDEFSALSMSADAANLFERLRSFGGAVIVSSQSYAGLGETAERLLGAATTILLHGCSDPERIGRRAGTVRGADYSYQLDRQGTPGRMTLRSAETPRIDPNTVRQFGVGEAYVIAHGRATQVQVAPLGIAAEAGWALLERGGFEPFRYSVYHWDGTPVFTTDDRLPLEGTPPEASSGAATTSVASSQAAISTPAAPAEPPTEQAATKPATDAGQGRKRARF
jgi:hypothetical protein